MACDGKIKEKKKHIIYAKLLAVGKQLRRTFLPEFSNNVCISYKYETIYLNI